MLNREFRWNDWNLEHATKHGCTIREIEAVVARGFPGRHAGDDKFVIEARGQGGRVVRVIYVVDTDDEGRLYVIHAMPLTTRRRR